MGLLRMAIILNSSNEAATAGARIGSPQNQKDMTLPINGTFCNVLGNPGI